MKRLNFFQNRPKALSIDINSYLNRIKENRESPSLAYLKRLHRAHLIHIPFENLDIHYGQKIILDYKRIFNKLILNKRGGFCYELNGLFYHLLYHLGFDCFLISASILNEESGAFGKEFDHMAIIVRLDEMMWLVDVGYGKGMIFPKKVVKDLIQMDYTDYWRLIVDPDEIYFLQVSSDSNSFITKYKFEPKEREFIQFIDQCENHQTSPTSPFRQKKLITRLTENGRITLTDRQLKIMELGVSTETPILNEDEFISKLDQHFGISYHQLIPRTD